MATPPTNPPQPALAPDPSMEDILASIRRILNEDEAPKSAPEPEGPTGGVLMLDSSMMVPETPPNAPKAKSPPEPSATLENTPLPDPKPFIPPPPAPPAPPVAQSVRPAQSAPSQPSTSPAVSADTASPAASADTASLVAPAAAAATAASVDALMRTLATERNTAVQRGGPTLEDVVRAVIRPMLKDWLDAHLPPLAERLVRAEIERVVSRMAP